MNSKILNIKEKLIKDFNEGMLLSEMSDKYSFNKQTISNYLKSWGYSAKNRRKLVKTNPFKNLEDPKVMYWLGFLAADGSIYEDRVNLQLSEKDYDVLEKYKVFLGNGPIIRKGHWKLNGNLYNFSAIGFRNKEVITFLNSIGITSKKTFTLNPKFHINEHFMRGFIDGDGSFELKSIDGRNVGRIRISTASNMMASKIINFYLEHNLYFRYYRQNNRTKIHEIVISKKEDVLKCLTLLYNNADTYMNRKYQYATQIRNILGKTP